MTVGGTLLELSSSRPFFLLRYQFSPSKSNILFLFRPSLFCCFSSLCPKCIKYREQCLKHLTLQLTKLHIHGHARLVVTPIMMCYKKVDITPEQVGNMWLGFGIEVALWQKVEHIRNIRNIIYKEHNRLHL
jgi:hypothetical protein